MVAQTASAKGAVGVLGRAALAHFIARLGAVVIVVRPWAGIAVRVAADTGRADLRAVAERPVIAQRAVRICGCAIVGCFVA